MKIDMKKNKSKKRKLKSSNNINKGKKKIKLENSENSEQVIEGANKVLDNIDDSTDDNTQEEVHVDDFSNYVEEELKFSKDFYIPSFRQKLKEDNFIPELRHFLHLAKKNEKFIAKYIDKKGNPLELVEAMEKLDKKNLYHISYACESIQLVLMEILVNKKEHLKGAINACRYLMKSYGQAIQKLLQSPSLLHRKIILKLLTAIVCLDPELGRQLLNCFDILETSSKINKFLSHSTAEINNESDESVRKTFIHFILSYLVDGNIVLIRNILDKRNLLKNLLSGLLYDDYLTVCVVLNTIKKYVIENPEILKTKKIYIFDLECIKNLMQLYDWQGPKSYGKNTLKKNNTSLVQLSEEETQYKNSVREAVHEFLIVLLSSRKYGLAFDSMKNFKQKRNGLQKKLLIGLRYPWLDNLKTDLIINVLRSCPDTARSIIKHYGTFLNPEKTGKLYWEKVANFMTSIISALDSTILRQALDQITLTEYTFWIKDICLTAEILVNLKGTNSLLSAELSIRLSTVKLLLAMFKQFCNYMIAILSLEKYKGTDLRRFKLDLMNYIFVNYPSMENILVSAFKTATHIDFNNKVHLEHLDVTLDLVLLVATHHRTFFNATGQVIDFIKFLDPIFYFEELGTANINLELKAIKTLLLLKPSKLTPKGKLFEKVLRCFINVFVNGETQNQKEAGNLLRSIFLNTYFFTENMLLEIDIWLQALKFFDSEIIEMMSFILYACFEGESKEISSEIKELLTETAGIKSNENVEKYKNLKSLFQMIDSGETVEGYVETLTLSELLQYQFLKIEKDDKTNKFLELLSILLFHYLPNPEAVYKVYSSNLNLYKSYMKSVLRHKSIENRPEISTIPYYNNIYESILNGEAKFFEIFEDMNTENGKIRIMENDKEYILNNVLEDERTVMLYIYLTAFVAINLTEHDQFEQKHIKASHNFLKNFLEVLHNADQQKDISFKGPIFGEADLLQVIEIPYLQSILKYIYCNHIQLTQNFIIFTEIESKQNFLIFLCELTNSVAELIADEIDEFLINLQKRLVYQIAIEIKKTIKTQNKPKGNVILKILESFRISSEQCIEILKYLCELNYIDYLDENSQHNKSIFFDILNFTLNRLAELKQSTFIKDIWEKITKIYIDLISHNNNEEFEINLEKLEDSIHNFLIVTHQCIEINSIELFRKFFEYKKLTKSTIKLAILFLERDESNLQIILLENIKENLSKKELIYPLLNVLILNKNNIYKFDEKLLKEIYQEFKNGFMKTIEKPQKSGVIYKENVDLSMFLVKEMMPLNECIDFGKKLIKTDAVEIYQLKLIYAIYTKAMESFNDKNSDDYKEIFVNFLLNCIQLYNIILRRDNVDDNKTIYLNYIIHIWIETYFKQNVTIDFDNIKKSQHWNTFYKNCLKQGIQIHTAEEVTTNEINSKYLKILAHLCSLIYDDKKQDENEEIHQIYEMILSHQKFSEIVLNNKQITSIKTQIYHLLLVLAQKNTKVLNKKHIPIFLGSYQAKLTNCDRYILALIHFYEENGINLYEFRPFIWGEVAISHYSLTKIETAQLEQNEPSIDQVMSLIDRFVSDSTVKNFPIWRKLNTLKQLPEEHFENPDNLVSNFGGTILENHLEYEIFSKTESTDRTLLTRKQIDNSLLKLCLKNNKIYEDCYDPAFIVPLMCMCFSAEVQSQPVRPVQNGLLSIVFSAMSSLDKEMRLAAGCCQLRYREHFESRKFFDKDLWMQIYDNVQNGLNQLQADWNKYRRSGIPRVPYISGLFLARAVNLLISPTDPLYKTIVMYLRLKGTFNFLCVPEFNVLFHNSEVNHTLFQQFILEIINDGIKCSSDLLILISNNIFKAIMGFYFSIMSNLELNLQILSIISKCCKIPASAKMLIDLVGILPWLDGVIQQLEYYKFDTIEAVISIISNLWFSIKIREKDFGNFKYIESVIFNFLIKLSPNITSRITLNNFARYLNILEKSAGLNHKILKEENLDRLMLCAQKHFDKNIWHISNIKLNGPVGVESKESFLKRLKDDNVNENGKLALVNLREFVIKWSEKEIL